MGAHGVHWGLGPTVSLYYPHKAIGLGFRVWGSRVYGINELYSVLRAFSVNGVYCVCV